MKLSLTLKLPWSENEFFTITFLLKEAKNSMNEVIEK